MSDNSVQCALGVKVDADVRSCIELRVRVVGPPQPPSMARQIKAIAYTFETEWTGDLAAVMECLRREATCLIKAGYNSDKCETLRSRGPWAWDMWEAFVSALHSILI